MAKTAVPKTRIGLINELIRLKIPVEISFFARSDSDEETTFEGNLLALTPDYLLLSSDGTIEGELRFIFEVEKIRDIKINAPGWGDYREDQEE
jgi:hypothetical protein